MLKLTAISLLSGLVMLLVGIQTFYVSPNLAGRHQAVAWNADTVRVERGIGTRIDRDLRLQLNASGSGIIVLYVPGVPAGAFPFLHLGFAHAPQDVSILVSWRTTQTGSEGHVHTIQDNQGTSSWLDTRELAGWSGDITSLAVAVKGQPGAAITITDVSMRPASLVGQLQSIYSDWTAFMPWQQSSINTHKGVGPTRSSFYPVAVTTAFLALSILAYVLMLWIYRAKVSFDWRVVATMFLACWIGLDLIWQGRLFRQLELTYETFYGKDSQGKLAAGTDGGLVQFIAEVKKRLDASDSRIFVSSSDDYLGMRGAYYLYPFNVFWQRRGPELPRSKYIRSGDYIVLVLPAKTEFNHVTGKLLPPQGKSISVEPILSRGVGSLYRVK
jgi:hypothetical protein